MDDKERNTPQTWMEARVAITAVLILAVGESEARRLVRLADLNPMAVAAL